MLFPGVQAVFENETTGTCTVLSCACGAAGRFCADSVPSVEKLSKVVPAVSFSDALYDWAGGAGAEPMTTEVSQLNCSQTTQALTVCMLVCTSVFHSGMRIHVNFCNDDSDQSVM
jgi:hypothetical protein